MLTQPCISRAVSRSDQDRNAKTTVRLFSFIRTVAHDKWATVSDSLRSLMINEQMSDSLKKCWLIKSKILFFRMFYIGFLLKNEWYAHSFILVSDVSKSLRLSTKNEQMGESLIFFEWIAHFFAKNERFAQKTNEPIPSPGFSFKNKCCFGQYFWKALKKVNNR